MTVRNVDSNLVQIIRDLQEEVKQLKANQGSVRLNSIRLGNWVLETVDDSLVKMTNLTTGLVSYIGAPGEGGGTAEGGDGAYVEVPPFSFGGIVRNAFSTVLMRTNVYEMPVTFEVTQIVATLVNRSGAGPIFRLYRNDVIVFTSTSLSADRTVFQPTFTLEAGDQLYVEVSDDGSGFNTGLQVMLRGLPTIIEQ